ncbi:MAG: glycosyltransferase family 2 protein [bacterium]|nr:glycosyltransferase family 2 protein [bacterium]
MNQSNISVIICGYTMDRLKDIHEAVDSALAQTLKPYEIVVAIDQNKELLERLKKELPSEIKLVLSDEAPGLSETRNKAIEASTGEIIAFLDDDAFAEKNWLENLTPPFSDDRVMAVGGESVPVWPEDKPPFWFPLDFDFIIGCTNHKKLILQASGEIRNVTGSNMAFRREVFQKVGLWETKLGRCEMGRVRFNPSGGEEAELCLRIKNLIPTAMIVFKSEAIVNHKVSPERTTLNYVFNYSFREGVTRAMINKIVSRYGHQPLAAENLFLRQLLFVSIPKRLLRFYKVAPIAQIGVLSTNLFLMGTGYLLGKWQYRKGNI